MESVACHRRDPELEDYLARVEQLDSARKGAGRTRNAHNVKPKYRPEDLEKAQMLLDGDYASSEIDYLQDVRPVPQMAYRSAYNYERTFSPKRGSTSPIRNTARRNSREHLGPSSLTFDADLLSNGKKQYTVSEDDYLLLQRLKHGMLVDRPSVNTLPSRGKPRESRVARREEESPPPPPLPTRREAPTIPAESLEPDEKIPPAKPPRRVKPITPPRREIGRNNPTPSDAEKVSTSKGSPLAAKQRPKKPPSFQESLSNNKMTTSSTISPGALPTPVKDTRKMPAPYIESLVKNKVTTASSKSIGDSPSQKKIAGKGTVSYLDSLKNNKATVTTPIRVQEKAAPVIKPESSPRMFISSVLKQESTLPTSSLKPATAKPLVIPSRRKALPEKSIPENNNVDELAFDSLKSKLKPAKERKVEGKQESTKEVKIDLRGAGLQIPKVRKQKPQVENTTLSDTVQLKPAPTTEERKPSIPEALSKRDKLSKAPPKPSRKISLPEAMFKKNQLNKASPAPVRKESIPEAMRRIEAMKSKKSALGIQAEPRTKNMEEDTVEAAQALRRLKPTPSSPKKPEEKPDAVVAARSLASRGKSVTAPQLSKNKNIPVAIPFMAQTNDPKIAKLLRPASENDLPRSSTADEKKELNHLTKNRARGPKRKLPKAVNSGP